MNVGEWLDTGLTLRSWKPSEVATEFREDARRMFQLCLDKLAGDAPQAFVPVQERVVLLPTYTSGSEGVRLASTSDPYVLKFTPNGGLPTVNKRPYPVVDGTWDGIYHLEITTADGTIHRRQSRTWWRASNLTGSEYTCYVSLDRPFTGSHTDLSFRIYAPEFFTRANITRLQDGVLYTSVREFLPLRPAFFRYDSSMIDAGSNSTGRPEYMTRGRHFQLQAPSYTPIPTLDDEDTWAGPEPTGKFKYRYTYVWGKKAASISSPGGGNDPQWESSPSPESEEVRPPGIGGATVNLSVPNIDYMLRFGDSGTLRYGRTGMRKRIYRARLSTNGVGGTQPIEEDGVYYFMEEVDGLTTNWVDNGTVTPDFYRRLPEINGYFAYSVVPLPDTTYELDLRCNRRPERLFTDTDAPEVEPAAEQALLQLFLSKLALLDKKIDESFAYEARYKEEIGAFVSTQGVRARTLTQTPYRGRVFGSYPLNNLRGTFRSV